MKKFILLLLSIPSLLVAVAQNRTVTGKVTDEKGVPVANASVVVKGTSTGTSTNPEGLFSITVPSNNSILSFSHINLAPHEMQVGSQSYFTVTMQGADKSLQEVVVTALGITRDRRTLGYATQTVKNEAIIDKGEGGLLNALQGKIAGADITGASGAAGSSTTILLRGVSSFTGSQSPLMVVDGIPVSDNVDESTVGLYSNQSSNRSMDLNVNNIESVNVLAGPAAAALYGSRAAHGAIMITTKKGSGQKGVVNVTFNSSYTQQKVYGFPELQNKYGQGASGVFSGVSANSLGPAFGSTPSIVNGLIVGAVPQYVNGINYTAGQTIPYQAFPDNIMSYFKTGSVFENNLSINSGDAKNFYGISLGHSSQTGILPNSEFNKTNVGFTASTYFTEKLSVKGGASYFNTVQQGPTQGSNGTYSAYANVYRMPRSIDFDYYKNHYTTVGGYNNWYVANIYNTAIQDSSSASDNPYFAAYKNPIKSNLTRTVGNLTLTYDISKWISVSYRAGLDAYTDRRKRTVALGSAQVVRSAFTGAPATTTGGIMEDIFYRSEFNGDLMITAKKSNLFLQGLNANFLVGQNVLQQKFDWVNQTGYGLAIPGFYNITNASNLSLTNEYNSVKRLWGIYGQVSLSYNNYLFLEFTGRQDRSSTLPKAKNAFFYPSVSASFVITDALKVKSSILSFAKIRAAYAKVGNDAPLYSLDNTFASAAVGNNVANYAFPMGTVAGFASTTTLGNKALTPEFVSTFDIGLNVGLFKNRLNIDATFYDSKSTDQIVNVGLPASTGYLNRYVNIGSMTNKGVELMLTTNVIKSKNFAWDVNANFSLNRNKVTALAPGVNSFSFGGIPFSGLIPTIAVGEPFGIIRGGKFVTNAAGERLIDSTTGLFANYVTDRTVLDPNRKWISGLTNTFTYQNFSLSVLVDYKHGGQFESFTVATLRANGSLKVTEDRDLPFILPGVIDMGGGKYRPNDIQINGQTYYNVALGGATGSTNSNEFAVFDASTFRLRELSLSYNLRSAAIGATRLFKTAKLTVYGRNLYFYAPNSPIDPELSTQGGGSTTTSNVVRGLELGSAPGTRNFGASLRLTF
ncbi:MAG TPA: SusC/RagA family TonB-linked outer membrane protein [Chitinophagaceae bacterium]